MRVRSFAIMIFRIFLCHQDFHSTKVSSAAAMSRRRFLSSCARSGNSLWAVESGCVPPQKNKRRSLMEERTTNAEDPRPTATRPHLETLLRLFSLLHQLLVGNWILPSCRYGWNFKKGGSLLKTCSRFFAQLTKDHSKSSFFKASNSFSCSLSCLQSEHHEFRGQSDARVPGSGCLHCHHFNASGKMLNCWTILSFTLRAE